MHISYHLPQIVDLQVYYVSQTFDLIILKKWNFKYYSLTIVYRSKHLSTKCDYAGYTHKGDRDIGHD